MRHDIESKMDNSDHNDGSNFAFDIDPVWMSPEPDPDECQTCDTVTDTFDTLDTNRFYTGDANHTCDDTDTFETCDFEPLDTFDTCNTK